MSAPRTCTISYAGGDRWVLSIDGTEYASAEDPERLTKLAELGAMTVRHGDPIGLSVRQALDLETALCRRLPPWMVVRGMPESAADIAALATVVSQLVEHAPGAAQRLLTRCDQAGS